MKAIARIVEIQKQQTENIEKITKSMEDQKIYIVDNRLFEIEEKIKTLEPMLVIMKYPKVLLVGAVISYLFTISEIRAVVLKALF